MVAPYEIGDPVRSFVRVPGSGTDKAAKSLCCDLSRVSSAAAAVPVRPIIQAAVLVQSSPRAVEQESKNEGKNREPLSQSTIEGGAVATPSGTDDVQSPQNQSAPETRSEPTSRKRHVNEDSAVDNTPAKRGRVLSKDASGSSKVIKKEESTSSICDKVTSLEKQCNELREQNVQLQKRLSLFCKLFKDPKKLAVALKRMEMQVK